MTRKILVINGHPDPSPKRFVAALTAAYAEAAVAAGHQVRRIDVGTLDFALLRSRADFEDHDPPPAIAAAQQDLVWADHLVIFHPLWMGSAPALLKGFFEQAFRYGFALPRPEAGASRGQIAGRSARLVVTMGMPAAVYRLVFGAFGVRAMARGILGLSGVRPVRLTLIGQVEGAAAARRRWLERLTELGRLGA
jgi:putative NADPH-quinone reductase